MRKVSGDRHKLLLTHEQLKKLAQAGSCNDVGRSIDDDDDGQHGSWTRFVSVVDRTAATTISTGVVAAAAAAITADERLPLL